MTRQLIKYQSFFKSRGAYKNYPLQEYLLEELGNGKELHILWRTLPVQKKEEVYTTSDREMQEHSGEYWFKLKWFEPFGGMFTKTYKEKTFYFKTLRDLKRAINAHFENHNYSPVYKVK